MRKINSILRVMIVIAVGIVFSNCSENSSNNSMQPTYNLKNSFKYEKEIKIFDESNKFFSSYLIQSDNKKGFESQLEIMENSYLEMIQEQDYVIDINNTVELTNDLDGNEDFTKDYDEIVVVKFLEKQIGNNYGFKIKLDESFNENERIILSGTTRTIIYETDYCLNIDIASESFVNVKFDYYHKLSPSTSWTLMGSTTLAPYGSYTMINGVNAEYSDWGPKLIKIRNLQPAINNLLYVEVTSTFPGPTYCQ